MNATQVRNRLDVALPTEAAGSRATGWWAMLVFIMNEAVLFASLVASYLYIRYNAPLWPMGGFPRPELLLPAIMTLVLLSSSVFMHWAQNGIRAGNLSRLRLGLAIAFVLGVIFIAMQAYEYSRAVISPFSNVYGSLFFAITGIHGIHVMVALLISAVVQVRAGMNHFNSRRYLAVENTVLYWHFVDVVWLFIFATLYLSNYAS